MIEELKIAVSLALENFLDPAPGSLLFDVATPAAGINVPAANDIQLVNYTVASKVGSIFLGGFSCSPTGHNVVYVVYVNGTPVFETDHQVTPNLWTLYPLRIIIQGTPAAIEVRGRTNTAPAAIVPDVLARLAGYHVAGSPKKRRRFIRSS